MTQRPSKEEKKRERQAARLGRQLLDSLTGPSLAIGKLAKGADHASWSQALRQACRAPNKAGLISALIAERDLSDPDAQAALFESALRLLENGDLQRALIALPQIESSKTPYDELIKTAVKHSSADARLMAIFKTRAQQSHWDQALFFLGQNGLRGSGQIQWAKALIEAGANPWTLKSAPLAAAMGSSNWELADFLAPLSDPRRLAQLIATAPPTEMPAARAHLERRDLQHSAQIGQAAFKPARRL